LGPRSAALGTGIQERGGLGLIELTNLNGASFVLNCDLIETIENIPETKITLTNGHYFLVGEEREEIVKKVVPITN